MPTFQLTSPQGEKYRITAPEGATEEDAFAQLQQHLGSAPKPEALDEPGMKSGMALSGIIPYMPQAEAAIRAAAQPLTGVGQPGATWSERYAANLPQRQEAYRQAEEESPWTSAGLKAIGGAAALGPIGATATGARLMGAGAGALPARMGMGGLSGAALGGAQAAGHAHAMGEDPAAIAEAAKGGVLWGAGGGVAAPVVGSIASRIAAPIQQRATATAAQRAAEVANLEAEGVSLSAGRRTGSKPLQYLESSLGDVTGAGTRLEERGREQFTRAALSRAGEEAPLASPEVVDKMFSRIGTQFDRIAANNTLVPDRAMGPDIRRAIGDYQNIVSLPNRAPAIANFEQEIAQALATNQNTIPGAVYQSLTSRMERTARNAQRSQPEVAETVRDIKGALDHAMERHLAQIGSSDLGAWRQARSQYRNALAIERAATRAGEGAAVGAISPSALRTAVVNQSRRSYARGQGDLGQLARSGEAVMKPLPQSGTAPRAFMSSVPAAVGAIGGGLLSGGNIPIAALGALAGPPLAGATLMSRPMQAWLGRGANLGAGQAARHYGTTSVLGAEPSLYNLLGYARGGRPPVGRPIMVGEKGPEVYVPDRPGTVVSNKAIVDAARRLAVRPAPTGRFRPFR